VNHGIIQVGQVVGCNCGHWAGIVPEDQTWTELLKSYAAHRPELKEAVGLLHYWQEDGRANNFTSILFMLMQKSDHSNRYRLRLGFPLEDEALNVWNACPSASDFFEAWGIGRSQDPPTEPLSHGTAR